MEAEFIELCSLTTHQVHKLFYSLELTQDERYKGSEDPGDEPINGDWLRKANSPQYLKDVFSDMRFSEVILLLVKFVTILALFAVHHIAYHLPCLQLL